MNTHTQTFLSKVLCAGLFAGLVASAPLKADEWLKFGAGLHIANPSGDLTDEEKMVSKLKMGFGLSVFGEMGLNDKMALRGRVDYNIFGEGKKEESESYMGFSSNYTLTLNANATTVFADFIYRFDSHEKGLYAFAGLGLVNCKLSAEWKDEWTESGIKHIDSDKDSESGSNFGFSLGLGYNFTKNMGLEVSYTTASDVIKPEGTNEKFGYDAMQVSFKFRF